MRIAMRAVAQFAGAAALLAATASGVELARLPANRWVKLGAGQGGRIARFIWLPEEKRGFLWIAVHYRSRAYTFEQFRQMHLFDPRTGEWSQKLSTFPRSGNPAYYHCGDRPYVYLPGLKKMLVLAEPDYKFKTKTGSWLLDPAAGLWEAVPGELRMRDNSKDFNPVRGMDGRPIPVMGALCYDGHNKEAISVGGTEVWGRVDGRKEKVKVGDWFYDETGELKRTRRLVAADEGRITKARRWHPGNCGTWVFSEATRKWRPLGQLMSEQPSGRIFPAMAYDAAEKKIVLFGGDNLARCLDDTWIYDCETKKWSQSKPRVAPPARACQGMVYLPDQKVILMAGGYGSGWTTTRDVWVYETASNKWTRLGLDLPVPVGYSWADYVPEGRTVLFRAVVNTTRRPKESHIYGLRLGPGSLPRARGEFKAGFNYHCQGEDERQPSPEEWESPRNRGSDPAAGRKELSRLPANTWVLRKTPLETASRTWGSYAYDARTHKAYAWGGGHGGYQGADVNEYDVLGNRWIGMVNAPDFKPRWRHKRSGDSPPGLTPGGCILIQSHARKSYAIDPLSDLLITSHGDLYSPKDRMFVGSIGRCPGKWRLGDQVGYVTAPHGLYGYNRDGLYKADVAAGVWEQVATGGPGPHSEHNPMTYDPKHDRILYLNYKDAAVWSFDFKAKKWREEKLAGKAPGFIGGDPAYVPELDAMMFVIATDKRGQKLTTYFYKVDEGKWYTAPYRGDASEPSRSGNGRLCNSTFWDPDLGVAVRICGHYRQAQVLVMRLDFKTLNLTPCD